MFETFKLGYAASMGVIGAVVTCLAIIAVWDWLGGIINQIKMMWVLRKHDRRPTL